MASKAAKGKKGPQQTRIVFAPMPTGRVFTGGGLTNFTISDAGIERLSTKTGRWLEPGEAVTLHGFHLPDGMIYYGGPVTALNGYGVEPALVNPSLPVAKPGVGSPGATQGYYPEYKNFDAARRWKYLNWLAHGRNDPEADSHVVYLFLYGLERRIISPHIKVARRSQIVDPPLSDDERQDLRNEIVRLAMLYRHPTFQGYAGGLLAFLDLTTILADPANLDRLNSEALAATTRSGGPLPTLLAVMLAWIASVKKPIPAEWAWAWFCQDAESNLRAAAVRCPKEMRQLFMARFPAAAGPKGITLRLTKPPVSTSYYPVGPGYSQAVSATSGLDGISFDWLRQVSRTPLKVIREIASDCMDELDAYSRRVGRDPDGKHTLPVVALLPDPLFAEHDAAVKFRVWLDTFVPAEPGSAAIIPAADLAARWLGAKEGESTASLTRSDTLALLDGIDRLGFAIEPDLRTGGPALAGPTAAPSSRTLIAAIARRAAGASSQAPRDEDTALLAAGVPLLVRAARAAGAAESPALPQLVLELPHAANGDRAHLAARLAYLVANAKESGKLPKPKELALEMLTPDERAQIADVLASAASLGGAVSPAAVTELIRLFALLGLPDSELFARLHASASEGSGRHRGGVAGADDGLATIHAGSPGTEYAIPKPSPKVAKKMTASGGRVAIDHSLVRQKEAESVQISTLLADIFTEEEPLTDDVFDVTVALEAPSLGGLEARHAALLRALLAKESWTKAEVAALARAESLMPNAALEAINEAAFERFEEPVLDGDDVIYISIDLAKQLLS